MQTYTKASKIEILLDDGSPKIVKCSKLCDRFADDINDVVVGQPVELKNLSVDIFHVRFSIFKVYRRD